VLTQPHLVKTLLLDGSHAPGDHPEVLTTLRAQLEAVNPHLEVITLAEQRVVPCMGCFHCWVKTPGVCVKNDDGRRVAAKVVQSDLLVLVTPVTFGGYASPLKRMIDALIQDVSPFFQRTDTGVRHQRRYAHYPALLAVGIMSRADRESGMIFQELVARNAHNFHAPAHRAVLLQAGIGAAELQAEIATALSDVTA
jgi:multimeric flavodoxin WrbA